MAPYYDHHSAKMLIKGKPIRFGYKICTLFTCSGYQNLLREKNEIENSFLASKVVWKLLSISSVERPDKHEIFFFSSHKLLTELSENNFKATGKIRDVRTERCPLKSPKEANK
ncbi:piggyBac transposable element-derived protein 3 [Trichonephila clavipes]|nr:piggyBac transposable element-derived protein 3 [Trichonephila clavipes]